MHASPVTYTHFLCDWTSQTAVSSAVHITTMKASNHYQKQLQLSIKMYLATEMIVRDFKEQEEI